MAPHPYAALDWLAPLDQLLVGTVGVAALLTFLAVVAVSLAWLRRSMERNGLLVRPAVLARPIHSVAVDPVTCMVRCGEHPPAPPRPRLPR